MAPEMLRRLTGRQRRRMAYPAGAERAQRRTVWREWGPVTAVTLVVFELLYFFVFADMLGGTSTAGVVVTAAVGCITVCSRFVQEYAMFRSTDAKHAPFLVVGVVSVGVLLVAMAAEALWKTF
ncbi:hypothetical protein [Nonomuraea helvata]|uniref:DUF202 domain-containing protein n=1 Tax=Nonomuraea helvata TaxID=37484 RepID=A0ABV5SHE1_9ACTN